MCRSVHTKLICIYVHICIYLHEFLYRGSLRSVVGVGRFNMHRHIACKAATKKNLEDRSAECRSTSAPSLRGCAPPCSRGLHYCGAACTSVSPTRIASCRRSDIESLIALIELWVYTAYQHVSVYMYVKKIRNIFIYAYIYTHAQACTCAYSARKVCLWIGEGFSAAWGLVFWVLAPWAEQNTDTWLSMLLNIMAIIPK